MEKKSQLIVADARILPDVFTKVLEVKKLMAQKGEKSFASACKRIGISRSAYYKYKDCVFSYEELFNRHLQVHGNARAELPIQENSALNAENQSRLKAKAGNVPAAQ